MTDKKKLIIVIVLFVGVAMVIIGALNGATFNTSGTETCSLNFDNGAYTTGLNWQVTSWQSGAWYIQYHELHPGQSDKFAGPFHSQADAESFSRRALTEYSNDREHICIARLP